jgi:hypothetical protein
MDVSLLEDISVLSDDIPTNTSWVPRSANDAPIFSEEYWLYKILAFSQTLSIQTLPTARQYALDTLGKGATTLVSQGLMSKDFHLAFKPVRSLDIFLRELTLLGWAPVRTHPYISQLQGISWDFRTFENPCPVLVFEKAPFSDLASFMSSKQGYDLDQFQRVLFCYHIAIALRDLEHLGKW